MVELSRVISERVRERDIKVGRRSGSMVNLTIVISERVRQIYIRVGI